MCYGKKTELIFFLDVCNMNGNNGRGFLADLWKIIVVQTVAVGKMFRERERVWRVKSRAACMIVVSGKQ